ncbi:hypothetical protein [Gemmobacter sp. 24YEA27]|uniref:hypothetical protein n=1 Tax=Gemmobacter sp. 24YEA27 TaxID=3040672 RepID=UPI0024B3BB69|nr:hypothetical protein [Gemmobacter sp. 24YEA27]
MKNISKVGPDAALMWWSQAHYLRIALSENLQLLRRREEELRASPSAELAFTLTGLGLNIGILQCSCLEFALKALISFTQEPPKGWEGHDCEKLWPLVSNEDRQEILTASGLANVEVEALLVEGSKSVDWRYAITPSDKPVPPRMDQIKHFRLLNTAMSIGQGRAKELRG